MQLIGFKVPDIMKILLLILVLTTTSGCTWVEVSEEGQLVQLLDESAVTECQRVGRVTAISREKVLGVKRNTDKLMMELSSIARNNAVSMQGNAIVPAGSVEGNEQVFIVYKCP
jgi:hypothetical protein